MNFFERQQVARRNTRAMIALFVLAVVLIIVAIDLVAAAVWLLSNLDVPKPPGAPTGVKGALASVPTWVYVTAAMVTALAILCVSLWEVQSLRVGGGARVARMIGARRVAGSTGDPLERRLLNVVEEMAIAAGTRVPAVYVMDEERGINAFAAGYDISNTVVAVTRGTLETLNRDELQAVIGHEFSHIVNGDMSLNIRMIGVLAGIVFLGAVGEFLMRSAGEAEGKEAAAAFALGVGLLVIGYIGLFFARLIKASTSRQREFLADASGVQFTRNPDGLAGALDQIRASGRDSLVFNRHAEDLSHLFFGQSVRVQLEGLFDTHPPIEERIKRVNPRFQPQGYRGKRAAAGEVATDVPVAAAGFAGGPLSADEAALADARAGDIGQPWGRTPGQSAALVGQVDDQKMEIAKRILATIPASVRERVRHPEGACATLVALVLAQNAVVMEEQLTAAKTAGAAKLGAAAAEVAKEIRGISPAYYLPLVDLALPALKLASAESKAELLAGLQAVIHADRRISMYEFVMFTLVRSQLSKRTGFAAPKFKSITEARPEVLFLLSLVAHAGCHRGPHADEEFNTAFGAGAKEMGLEHALPLARGALGMDAAGDVLASLRELAPLPKAVLVKGLFATVTADGKIRVIEAALMRMMGAVLDCPLPPMLEDLDPAALAA